MQSGGPSEACMKNFMPLREEAEKRGKLIKVASEHHASPEEACKLIENFSQAEIRMMRYVEANATKCGIPPQIHAQLEKGHSNTEMMQKKVCTMAQQRPAGPSLSEALGSAVALPEATPKKKGGKRPRKDPVLQDKDREGKGKEKEGESGSAPASGGSSRSPP